MIGAKGTKPVCRGGRWSQRLAVPIGGKRRKTNVVGWPYPFRLDGGPSYPVSIYASIYPTPGLFHSARFVTIESVGRAAKEAAEMEEEVAKGAEGRPGGGGGADGRAHVHRASWMRTSVCEESQFLVLVASQAELGRVWVGLDAWKPWTTLGRLVGFPPRLSARIEAHRHGSNVGTTAAA
ncbi:hypothetical protein KM043_005166 [Ampulex compressa]|nr:hypothetical protein KM043_005166 [Ampulex compressa]